MKKVKHLCVAVTIVSALTIASCMPPVLYAVGNQMQGSCINDPGRGGLIWGTSSEITTYSEPYTVFKTPEIYRIPISDGKNPPSAVTNDSNDGVDVGNPMERLSESGTIFGTDGKPYEYYYLRGVEPRRVVTYNRVEKSKGLWVNEPVEKIIWEPVLIRVLRPVGTNIKESQRVIGSNPLSNAPQPCAPLSTAAERPINDVASTTPTLPINPNSTTPPVEGTAPQVKTPTLETLDKNRSGSVRIVTPPAANSTLQQPRPILVLPEEARAQQEEAQRKARAQALQRQQAPSPQQTPQRLPLSASQSIPTNLYPNRT